MPSSRRTCQDEHPNPLETAARCKVCWLYCSNPAYNRFWGGTGRCPGGVVPCKHLGEVTGERVRCRSCRGKVELKVFSCAVHQRCHPDRVIKGVACCLHCADYQPAWDDFNPQTPVEVVREFLRTPSGPRPSGWTSWDNTAEAFRLEFDEVSQHIPPPPPFPIPRGLVICGGGWRFFPSVYVTVRMIRHLGCRFPIHIWYLGDRGECEPAMEALLAPHDVTWVDGNAFWRDTPGVKVYLDQVDDGWMLKPLAAAYSPFREVISLDADSYPVLPLEEFLEDPRYQEVGAAFWPDIAPLQPGQWQRFGIQPRGVPGLESGQFIVDKSRHWKPLWLALWLNTHHAYVWRHLYGDKDTFNIAWGKLNQPMCIPTPLPGWLRHSYLQKDFQGKTLFVHRTRGKFKLSGELGETIARDYRTAQHPDLFEPNLPLEEEAHTFARELEELLRSGEPFLSRPIPEIAGGKNR
jgi:hypothetical protein